jgi:hypothetical protein
VSEKGEDHLSQLAQKHTLEALQSLVKAMRSGTSTNQKKAANVLRNRAELVRRLLPDDAATIEHDVNRILGGR